MEIENPQESQMETPSRREKEDHRELVLDNWKLILIFFVALVVCVVFFAAGLIVGRHQPRASETPMASKDDVQRPSPMPATQVPAGRLPIAPAQAPETIVTLGRPAGQAELGGASTPSTLPSESPAGAAGTSARSADPPAAPPGEPVAEVRVSTTLAPAPAAQPTERPLAKPAAGGNVFRVQIAASKSEAEAQAIVERLKKKGFETFIVPPRPGGDSFFRIQMGDYSNRAEAQEVLLKLQQAGEKPILRRQ